jgi:8-oxo-dGTP diphosphatase
MKKRIYCAYCGGKIISKDDEGVSRDFCKSCGIFFYDNPLPVVSTILASDRKILLVKRGRRPYRGKWCLPTGFAEIGESIEEAALRELAEETGVQGLIVNLVDVDSLTNDFYGDLLFITFEVEMIGGELSTGSDCIAIEYFQIEKRPNLAFKSNKKAIDAYIRNKSDYWAIVDSFAQTIGDTAHASKKKHLLSDRLVNFIEMNSEKIARIWLKDVTTKQSTSGYRRFNSAKLYERAHVVLSQFGKWLGGYYTDSDIRDFYVELGRERRKEGFKLSEVISALSLTKKHIWEFALSQGMWQKPIDIYTTLELNRRIVIFFDRAAFYTVQGYETAKK